MQNILALFIAVISLILPVENPQDVMISYVDEQTYISYATGAGEFCFMQEDAYDGGDLDACSVETETLGGRTTAKLAGLEQASRYVYQIGNGQVHAFETPSNEKTFSFGFLGDTQMDPDSGKLAMRELLEQLTDERFLLIAGDLVNDTSNKTEWKSFFMQGGDVFADLPVMSVAGNHAAGVNQTKGKLAGFSSFEYGDAHFVLLDSNLMGNTEAETVDMIQTYLKDDLAATDKKWKIALMHHPLFPVNQNPKDAQRAKTMLEQYGAYFKQMDVVLCGHEHAYARAQSDGILQIMGNASEKQYAAVDMEYIAASAPGPVYTRVQVEEDTMTILTFDRDGKQVDPYVLQK